MASTDNAMTTARVTEDEKDFVRSNLTPERWEHTRGVMELGTHLTEVYDLETEEFRTAALFHDNARDLSESDQHQLAVRYRNGLDDIEDDVPGLWHAPAGAQRMIEAFDYDESNRIVRAVGFHSTARPNPSTCLLALVVADFAEPNRSYPEAQTIRSTIGDSSLPKLACATLEHKLRRMLETNRRIHPRSIECWNQLCD